MATATRRRAYPLEVERWGEDGELLLSRGHHEPRTFREAAQAFCVDELDDTALAGRLGAERVYREWWRFVPHHDDGSEWLTCASTTGRTARAAACSPSPT